MANISDLICLLSPILGLHASTLARHASQLRVAGLLPHEDENLAAGEAAVFLAAATAARAPTEAVEAARVFASLPLFDVQIHNENPATGAEGGARLADQPLPKATFVATLEHAIHRAMAPDRILEELPSAIGIMRNLRDPYALLVVGRMEIDGIWHDTRLVFGAWDAGSPRNEYMQVWCYLPALTIPLVGDLLAGRDGSEAAHVGHGASEEEFL